LLFSFPNTVYVLALGQILRGIFDPFMMIPALPEMIDVALPMYPKSSSIQINDISSGLFNMFIGIGQIIGPIYGSFVTKAYGF
jgi:hypothetical protein